VEIQKNIIRIIISALESRLLPCGGFATVPGEEPRPDATAWAVFALSLLTAETRILKKGRQNLSQLQTEKGSIPLTPETPAAVWPTYLALLAWNCDDDFKEQRAKAIDYLLIHGGRTIRRSAFVAHNTKLQGWPWIENTYSWVEPTSLTIMSLKLEGKGEHSRVKEGIDLLLDRMLSDGGWNYGNKRVFGNKLLPMPVNTGMALCALQDNVSEETVLNSLNYLTSQYPFMKTPLSLAWTILGLSTFNRRPHDVSERIDSCLRLQQRYGPFKTSLLAQLGVALTSFCGGGRKCVQNERF